MSHQSENLHSFITARKQNLGQGNVFTPLCHSVQQGGLSPSMHHRSHEWGSLSRGGLCPGVSLSGGVSVQGVSLSRGSLCQEGSLSKGSLSRETLSMGGLSPGGVSVWGVSVQGRSLSRGSLLGRLHPRKRPNYNFRKPSESLSHHTLASLTSLFFSLDFTVTHYVSFTIHSLFVISLIFGRVNVNLFLCMCEVCH